MINNSYTLLTRIPIYKNFDGLYTDDLWEKDLSAHIGYLSDFRICCPVEPYNGSIRSLKRINLLAESQVRKLRTDYGWRSVAANFLPNFLQVAKATRETEIVHTSCAGWAFSLAYYILILRPFMTFKWINVVESSFWRKPTLGRVTLRQNISHYLNDFLVRCCVRTSDARIFTQDWYRAHYLGSHKAALVNTAVWINDSDFRTDSELMAVHAEQKLTRLIFPARLTPEKGVETIIAAVEQWDIRYNDILGPSLQIDIVGEGPLAGRCRNFIKTRQSGGRLQMKFLEPVPYGPAFFDLIRSYSAAIILNRQAEQARIVIDVMAQGLACLASDTSGNRAVVVDGDTGVIFPVDDASTLAQLFDRAAREKEWLQCMGRNALSAARGFSHSAMHLERKKFLQKTLEITTSD